MKNTRSCFSIGGVYSRSVLAYALGGRVGVGYVCDKTGKPGGRFWIIFPENKKCFLFQPAYGFISPSVVATLGQYIAGMIDPKGTWKRIDLDTICVNEFKNRFTPYRDSSKYLYYEGEIQAGTAGYFDLVSAPDKCILCGMPHDEQGELICARCRSTKFTHCAVCGRSILASQGSTQICEKCIASKHICPKCGDIVSHNVCPKCAWENKCMICGSILGANALRTSLGDVCANCQTMLTATDCAVCGHKGLTYPHVETGTPLCMTCFRLVYMTGLEHVDFQSVNLDIKKKLMDLAVNNAIHNDYEGVGGIRHD